MPSFGSWPRFACASLLFCSSAVAQPSGSAREYFARGVEQAEVGDFDSAVSNFEQAYLLSPHYAVLYNLGQAYSAIGKPIEATRAFEMYLEGGGAKIAVDRQTEVRQLIQQSKKRIGHVAVEIQPADAKLFIDGRAIDSAALRGPLSLTVGVHGVALTLIGMQTFVGRVNVQAQTIVPLKIKLEPAPVATTVAATERSPVGQVAVDSQLPQLDIFLDGVAIERIGTDPMLAPVGRHRLRCVRDGYQPVDAEIDVLEKGAVHVACDLTPAAGLPATDAGFVSFNIDQPGAAVFIDGRRTSTSTRLPRGTHVARIRRGGFSDWTRTITARPGFPETISVQLQPTPEHALELARASSKRRTYAYVIGGAGIALLGTSAVLYATNNGRYSTWAAQNDQLSRDIQAQRYNEDLSSRTEDLQRTATSIQRQDDAALGVAVVGGLLVGYAVISWLGSR